MLDKIVGSKPSNSSTPMHTAVARLVKPVLESQRNVRKLKRAGVDPDAAVAVLCNLEFYANLLPSAKRCRRGGTFLDEEAAAKLGRGGVYLSSDAMKKIMAGKEKGRAEKEAEKVAKAAAVALAKTTKAVAKATKAAEKEARKAARAANKLTAAAAKAATAAAKKEAAAAKRAAAEERKREGPFTPFRASVAKQGTAAAQSAIATTTANAQNIGYIEFLL
jgi:pyruvate/2-oxoglutarate dehydrogenase complex dihydrolipoamide acyltransferase (E2) component